MSYGRCIQLADRILSNTNFMVAKDLCDSCVDVEDSESFEFDALVVAEVNQLIKELKEFKKEIKKEMP